MVTQDQKDLLARWSEFWATGNPAIPDELVTADFVLHDPSSPTEIRGPEGLKRWAQEWGQGVPDLHFTARGSPLGGQDRVAIEWTMRGTQTGPFLNLAPTGKSFAVDGVDICRFAGNRIAENWSFWDTLTVWRQLGVPPTGGDIA